ncbi:cytochrome P450 [Scytonema sp. UIC 10036]|uniref:cytochrome P450 n=1 Tax=Scytonema sp. UIC 10036 TaxID=2304196 RepID=UPI0012DAD68B|nr:cytochrome P450 [Scytonema sp. UIC 10036]MUG91833.1 cytochrome P450 [Scytonema sp. UIC 10036]
MTAVKTFFNENQLPDGPKAAPFFQLLDWIARPFEYLDECTDKYGDLFTLRLLGFSPLVFITNPQGIKEIFNLDGQYFDAAHTNKNGGGRLIMGDNSLILMDGARHERERKLLMPPFHGEKVKSYAKSICEITEKVASLWKIDRPFLARDIAQEITLKVIMQVLFGFSEGEKCERLSSLIAHWLHMTSSPLRLSFIFLKPLQVDLGPWSPWGNFIRTKQKIHDLFQVEIDDKRTHPEKLGNDILSLMLSATDSEGQSMSDEQLKDELITLLSAGHETTANGLAWGFYWLAKNPSVKEKLSQEIDSLGKNPDPIEISRLPYLTAVCQEILRLYPVVQVALARFAKQDIEIMGRCFKAGTTFIPSIYSVHRREDLYPNSKQFQPERFLERQYTAYEFLPFGGGVRMCLGHALAMLEMKLVIATIVSKYNLELADDKPIKPIRRSATISPSNGVPLVVTGLR